MKTIIKANVPTIFKRGLPEAKKLRRETDTTATSHDTYTTEFMKGITISYR